MVQGARKKNFGFLTILLYQGGFPGYRRMEEGGAEGRGRGELEVFHGPLLRPSSEMKRGIRLTTAVKELCIPVRDVATSEKSRELL